MRDGALRIKFEDGKIIGYATSAGLDSTYDKMFRKAKANAKRYPKNIEHGIHVLTFGAFYIESITNKLYKDMLDSKIELKALSDSLWEATKRMSIREKISVILSALPKNFQKETTKFNRNIQNIFDLRNRLAHFKDKEIELSDTQLPMEVKKNCNDCTFGIFLESVPDPDLLLELKGAKILKHAIEIESIEKFINKLHSRFIKTTDLSKTAKKTLNAEIRKSSKNK